MPLKNYGVLAGRVVASQAETGQDSPHFQIHVRAAGTDYRVAVNVLSRQAPSELLYAAEEHFAHPLLGLLPGLADGITELAPKPGAPPWTSFAATWSNGTHSARCRIPRQARTTTWPTSWPTSSSARPPTQWLGSTRSASDGAGAERPGQDLRLPPRQRGARHPHEPGQQCGVPLRRRGLAGRRTDPALPECRSVGGYFPGVPKPGLAHR